MRRLLGRPNRRTAKNSSRKLTISRSMSPMSEKERSPLQRAIGGNLYIDMDELPDIDDTPEILFRLQNEAPVPSMALVLSLKYQISEANNEFIISFLKSNGLEIFTSALDAISNAQAQAAAAAAGKRRGAVEASSKSFTQAINGGARGSNEAEVYEIGKELLRCLILLIDVDSAESIEKMIESDGLIDAIAMGATSAHSEFIAHSMTQLLTVFAEYSVDGRGRVLEALDSVRLRKEGLNRFDALVDILMNTRQPIKIKVDSMVLINTLLSSNNSEERITLRNDMIEAGILDALLAVKSLFTKRSDGTGQEPADKFPRSHLSTRIQIGHLRHLSGVHNPKQVDEHDSKSIKTLTEELEVQIELFESQMKEDGFFARTEEEFSAAVALARTLHMNMEHNKVCQEELLSLLDKLMELSRNPQIALWKALNRGVERIINKEKMLRSKGGIDPSDLSDDSQDDKPHLPRTTASPLPANMPKESTFARGAIPFISGLLGRAHPILSSKAAAALAPTSNVLSIPDDLPMAPPSPESKAPSLPSLESKAPPLLDTLPKVLPVPDQISSESPLPGTLPMPPPLPGQIPRAPPLPGTIPMPPPLPGQIPRAPPLPGTIPMPPPLPGQIPRAPPLPGTIPMPPPLPGQIPRAPPLLGTIPMPPPLPGQIPRAPPLPGTIPMPPPLPGQIPRAPPLPGTIPMPPPLPGQIPRAPPMPGSVPNAPPLSGLLRTMPTLYGLVPGPMAPPLPSPGGLASTNRSIAQSTPKTVVIKKKIPKRRAFYWEKVSDTLLEGTVFKDLKPAKVKVPEELLKAAFEERQKTLEEIEAEKKLRELEAAAKANRRPAKVSLIDSGSARNAEIVFKRFKMEPAAIVNAVLTMDKEVLTSDRVESLRTVAITGENATDVKKYHGPMEKLDNASLFIVTMMKVPRLSKRLECMAFMWAFDYEAEALRNTLELVKNGAEEIINSESLRRILEVTVAMGNFLNEGTTRGAARGIRLSSLLKLETVKTLDKRRTLLHVFAEWAAEEEPSLLSLWGDLEHCKLACNEPISELTLKAASMRSQLDKVKLHEKNSQKESNPDPADKFVLEAQIFIEKTDIEIKSIEDLCSSALQIYADSATMYGEEMKQINCDFFNLVVSFITMLERADCENRQRKELEERKQRAEEKIAQTKIDKMMKRAAEELTKQYPDDIQVESKSDSADVLLHDRFTRIKENRELEGAILRMPSISLSPRNGLYTAKYHGESDRNEALRRFRTASTILNVEVKSKRKMESKRTLNEDHVDVNTLNSRPCRNSFRLKGLLHRH